MRIDKDSYEKLKLIQESTNEILDFELSQENVESKVC